MIKNRTFVWFIPVLVALLHTNAAVPATWEQCPYRKWADPPLRVLTDTPDPEVDELFVSGCGITALKPGDFNNVPNITFINFEHNLFNHIPDGVFNNPNLKTLSLYGNRIIGENISPKAFQNCSLDFLDLGGNHITGAPDDLLQGQDLKELHLKMCYLEEIPSFVTKATLPHLSRLKLYDNRIRRLDNANALANVPNVYYLDLSYNSVEYISEELFKPLNSIISINVSNNLLTTLPEKLFQHKMSLSELNLADNQLEVIPLNAFEGTDLKSLDLSNNKLSQLPNNILSVSGTNLREFRFFDNPWKCSELHIIVTNLRQYNINFEKSRLPVQSCIISVKYSELYGVTQEILEVPNFTVLKFYGSTEDFKQHKKYLP